MPYCLYCGVETELSKADKTVCAKCLDRDWGQLRQKNQTALVNFLSTDLDLALTLLDTAKLAAEERHWEHARSALDKARAALSAIRRLSEYIQHPEERTNIGRRADELEKTMLAAEKTMAFPGDSNAG